MSRINRFLFPDPIHRDQEPWKALGFSNLYRLVLVSLLLLFGHLNDLPPPLASSNYPLFIQVTFLYLIGSLFFIPAFILRWPKFAFQLNAQVLLDIIFLTLIMHASGGVRSGVGMLLVISVANHSLLTSGKMPSLFASLAVIAILLEQTYSATYTSNDHFNYPFAGFFGIALFLTTLLIHALSKRVNESEAKAEEHRINLANMAQLTQIAIAKMQTGVIALDSNGEVQMANQAVRRLLYPENTPSDNQLVNQHPQLKEMIVRWQINPQLSLPIITNSQGQQLSVQLTPLGNSSSEALLLFLEDAEKASQQAQQLKLAALGRLTASIAHEIRNPLGAISHASQLLAESEEISTQDIRLTEIIHDHTHRLNAIVESILNLGRGKAKVKLEPIPLGEWLEKQIKRLEDNQQIATDEVEIDREKEIKISFDKIHLQQILWNLLKNGLRHSPKAEGSPGRVKLQMLLKDENVHLHIIDYGPILDLQSRQNLFEPFYTTDSKGTGLGLYLSQVLADANGAQLAYIPSCYESYGCFQLTFKYES